VIDLIDREAILKDIEKIRQNVQMMDDTHRASITMNGVYLCEKAVRNQPSAQAERKKGRWVGEGDGYADGSIVLDMWYCSNCDYCYEDDEKPKWNYCPNCGAEMEMTE